MLSYGKSVAAPTTTRLLSPAKLGTNKTLLGLPERAHDDFEKIVTAHIKAIVARESKPIGIHKSTMQSNSFLLMVLTPTAS
jgi:hypothetical protein